MRYLFTLFLLLLLDIALTVIEDLIRYKEMLVDVSPAARAEVIQKAVQEWTDCSTAVDSQP
jgi:hypothetical protein